ncbi:hypothetical protein, unlikely [Trypanosoma brucei gambiense DAL972]|uniref:Uncharacterized protein n=1 Tax=Trypanosoma brucei gambiense (strain MHOM/CI/86/DAL972) TaxID=679716 RepID=C9ZWM1_TRYB9|nr:hypothetical protein, unlikely [Trypanosoma brucei gambiense DAL972]CBH13810.1 hypothetical protein, unlikely [Trypanosoma brucei gambiense DAL972]|eukprot:XP_011776086.1 hypothetical protein, unlikely [Trypanosoma brucei gambiense DAL972]
MIGLNAHVCKHDQCTQDQRSYAYSDKDRTRLLLKTQLKDVSHTVTRDRTLGMQLFSMGFSVSHATKLLGSFMSRSHQHRCGGCCDSNVLHLTEGFLGRVLLILC